MKAAEGSSGIMSLNGSILLSKVLVTTIYLPPSGLLDITNLWLSGGIGFAITPGNIHPALLGMSPFYIVLSGILWMVIPLILAIRLASGRD